MNSAAELALARHLATHHNVVTRAEALALGLTSSQIDFLLRAGRLVAIYRGVYVLGGAPATTKTLLLAGCRLGGDGAAASHRSAGWAWHLLPHPPQPPEITVPRSRSPRLRELTCHRTKDDLSARTVWRKAIPLTDPARTVFDLGGVLDPAALDHVIDVALAQRLVTPGQLADELLGHGGRGRLGTIVLRDATDRMGLLGSPDPSVLESRVLRLLRSWGFDQAKAEVPVCGGRYRVDVMIVPRVALEVDGFTFHSSPRAKAADSTRRNDLRAAGIIVVESDWVTVTRHPERLWRQLRAACRLVGIELPVEPPVRGPLAA